jgi:hypothetical protein
VDELQSNVLDDLAAFLKPCRTRLADVELDADSMKNISLQLVRKQANVITGKLDCVGASYAANTMMAASQMAVGPSLRAYADMVAADAESEPGPWLRCVLRIVQEVRSQKTLKPPEKEWGPFEKQRHDYQQALLAKSRQNRDWIG